MKLFGRSETFIEIYDDTLTQKECDIIISRFEKSSFLQEGKVSNKFGLVVDHSYKKCTEIESPLFSQRDVISTIILPSLTSCVDKYYKKHHALQYSAEHNIFNQYNVQKYETEDDGFKQWHTEHCVSESRRILAWMIYLNDAKSGTEFMSYPTVQAKKGRCVIWPAGFTHTHRGLPNKGLKYIATGWVSFVT